MTNNYNEQPDELQQPQPQQQPTLPLLYLPIELAEEISLYFVGRDAAKLIRVSRSFYSLFLPRVWADLDTFATITDDEMKRHMLKKYGHFVRIIDFYKDTIYRLSFDWLPFVKRATHLKSTIHKWITVERAEVLMKLIKQSKMLRTLGLYFNRYDTPVKFDELAVAINGLKHLERLACEFVTVSGAMGAGSEWKRAASFIDLLHPTKRSKLRLKIDFNISIDEVDVQELAPYIDTFDVYGDDICTANLAHELFGIRGKDGQPLMFPQLKELKMTSCCLKSEGYSIKGITAGRLPHLQHLYFDDVPCGLLDRDDPRRNEHDKHNWKPEHSGYPHIIISSQRWQCLTDLAIGIISSSILMNIIDLNPQLQQLSVGSQYSKAPKVNDASKYNHDEFQLENILERLPHLKRFSIGRLNSRVVVNPAAIPTKRQHNINITIGCQMSIAPSATAYIMQMPQLTNLSFNECIFTDVDETIQLLQNNAATCGVKRFQWYPIVWHQELALAMTNKMPRVEWFKALKCPKEHRAIFEAKCEFQY
ncbi:hypothetical protein GQ42DRAFT_165735 [Ramicandelaber brevisporus]|nr:hypothetical protein GQ42DRAFT_165735 [Ramicandelaber brevisporus]